MMAMEFMVARLHAVRNSERGSAIVEYALVHLKIRDIVVCGHTRCGGVAARG